MEGAPTSSVYSSRFMLTCNINILITYDTAKELNIWRYYLYFISKFKFLIIFLFFSGVPKILKFTLIVRMSKNVIQTTNSKPVIYLPKAKLLL